MFHDAGSLPPTKLSLATGISWAMSAKHEATSVLWSSTLDESEKPHALVCTEVWGGNRKVNRTVKLPSLMAWVASNPINDGEGGGDLHYMSVVFTFLNEENASCISLSSVRTFLSSVRSLMRSSCGVPLFWLHSKGVFTHARRTKHAAGHLLRRIWLFHI